MGCIQSGSTKREEAEEAPFPLMQLNNELLAGVAQRMSEKTRQHFESVDQRAAVVTLSHGYIRRHCLAIDLAVSKSSQPNVGVGGIFVDPHEAPSVVRWLLARRRRVTHLVLAVDVNFDNAWLECTREPLTAVLDMILGSGRLHLTTVNVGACFGRSCDDVATRVARLLQRHVATIVSIHLTPCLDGFGKAAEHAHVELCQAVAACVGVRRFVVHIGNRRCLKSVERDCFPAFNQLRQLIYASASFHYEALPRPSTLEELTLLPGRVSDHLADLLLLRPDVCSSLRSLDGMHYGFDLPDGFLDAAPRLEMFAVVSDYFVRPPSPFARCDPLTFTRSLVGQFFAGKGGRRLIFQLSISLKDEVEQGGEAVSFESVCAKLLSDVYAAAPGVPIACSHAKVFLYACGHIVKAAVEEDPALAPVVRRLLLNFLQSTDNPTVHASIVAVAGFLLEADGDDQMPDDDAAAPFDAAAAPFDAAAAAAVAAAAENNRLKVDTALTAEATKPGDVVYQLTRGDGADQRRLDIVVCKEVYPS